MTLSDEQMTAHEDRRDARAGDAQPRDPRGRDQGRRRRPPPQLLARHARGARASSIAIAREASRARRPRGRPARRPARARSCGSASIDGDVLQLRHGQIARRSRPTRDRGTPRRAPGRLGGPARRRSSANDVIYLADGSIRLRVRETDGNEVADQGRDRRHGHLAPGHEPARRRGRARRASARRTSTGSTSPSSRAST